MALRHVRQPVAAAGQTPGYAAQSLGLDDSTSADPTSPDEDEPAAEDPATEGQAAAQAPTTVAGSSRLLTAFDQGLLVRGLSGSCPDAASVVETSFDGGQTWAGQDLTASLPLAATSRLIDLRNGTVVVLGANVNDCAQPLAFVSGLGSGEWFEHPAGELWRVDTEDASIVHTRGGAAVAPGCEVSQLDTGSAGVGAVLCRDSSVAVTADGGASWNHGPGIAGANSVALMGASPVVAAVEVPGCSGVQVTPLGAGLDPAESTCVAAEVGPEGTALASAPDGSLWLWAGESVFMSTDGGATWQ